MMKQNKGLYLIIILLLPHILLGGYAVHDGGFFTYGLTAPERLLFHSLSASETHITLTGAQKHVANDLCLQPCRECPMDCYNPRNLKLVCDGDCRILTLKGKPVAEEGDEFTAVLKTGLLLQDTTFKCYADGCGFDIKLGGNYTFSSRLPEGITN
jgi:hypothetical protein